MISILVTAEVRLYRDSLAFVLEQDDRFTVHGLASSCKEILSALRRPCADPRATPATRPDVLLLDLALYGSERMLGRLARVAPDVSVVLLAVEQNEADIIACAEAGAAGYVTRDAPIDDLMEAIVAAVSGELRCSPSVAGSLFRRICTLARRTEAQAARPRLTARENEVLAHIERGCSNKLIARELGIEVATVKNHVHSILGKLGARGRGEAAAMIRDNA